MYKPFERYMPKLVVCCCNHDKNQIDLTKHHCCSLNYQLSDLINADVLFSAADQMNACTRYAVRYRAIDPTTYQYAVTDNYLGITRNYDQSKLDTKDLPDDTFIQMLQVSAIFNDHLNLAQLGMFAECFPKSGFNKLDNGYDVYSDAKVVMGIRHDLMFGVGEPPVTPVDYVPLISVFDPDTNQELVRYCKRLENQGIVFYDYSIESVNALTTIHLSGLKQITDHGLLYVTLTLNDLMLDDLTFDKYRALMIKPQLNSCE